MEKAVGALEAARVEVGNAKRTAERAQASKHQIHHLHA